LRIFEQAALIPACTPTRNYFASLGLHE